ncbi:HGxxPAAW family protein [uncultured Pseudokineococcus sp.]|uniref:HGxxPAAW family protein n=1 Tax=uncultured Pseudokineococcus sp. TaxID=1642928 RepID=UPI00260B9AED|nr:HGxxPAAW family protein [uncultured Pseudokineococcus sp.]
MAERTQDRDTQSDTQPDTRHQPQLPPHTEDHGHSLAAWVGVGIVMLGSLVGCLAVVFTVWWLLAVGFVVMAVGPVVGIVLAKMGYGAGTPEQSSDEPGDEPHHGPAGRSGESASTTANGPR